MHNTGNNSLRGFTIKSFFFHSELLNLWTPSIARYSKYQRTQRFSSFFSVLNCIFRQNHFRNSHLFYEATGTVMVPAEIWRPKGNFSFIKRRISRPKTMAKGRVILCCLVSFTANKIKGWRAGRKPHSNAISSTMDPTWSHLRSNQRPRGEQPVSNRLSYDSL